MPLNINSDNEIVVSDLRNSEGLISTAMGLAKVFPFQDESNPLQENISMTLDPTEMGRYVGVFQKTFAANMIEGLWYTVEAVMTNGPNSQLVLRCNFQAGYPCEGC